MANPEAASYPTAVVTDQEITPWTDRFVTTLAAAIDADDTTIIITDASPGGDTLNDPCVITIDNEQIKINSRSGNSLSVGVRGYSGTAAAAHTAGATVRANLTAFMWNRVCAEIKAIETLLGASGVNITTLAARKEYKTSSNFTVPSGVTEVRATLIAGGGGGGGANSTNGGGGGGAGEVKVVRLTGLTSGGTITCTYGAAGTAGTGGSSDGGNGGDTSISGAGISGTITARGGRGGTRAGAGGESGSGATGGTLDATTRPGEIGWSGAGAGGRSTLSADAVSGGGMNARLADVAGDTNIYKGGGGGGCPYGVPGAVSTAAAGGGSATPMNGGAGTGAGAGGSGGSRESGVYFGDGGAGAAGAIYFEW